MLRRTVAYVCAVLLSVWLGAVTNAQAVEELPQHRPEAVSSALRSPADFDPSAQQTWLEDLAEKRFFPAAKLVTDESELERLRRDHRRRLELLRSGVALDAVACELLVELVDQYEKRAIEHLAREFRITNYSANRADRKRFDAYQKAWEQTQVASAKAGRPTEIQPQVIAWLQNAIHGLKSGTASVPPATFDRDAATLAQNDVAPAETQNSDAVGSNATFVDQDPFAAEEAARDRATKTVERPATVQPRVTATKKRMGRSERSKELVAERNPPLRVKPSVPARRDHDVDAAVLGSGSQTHLSAPRRTVARVETPFARDIPMPTLVVESQVSEEAKSVVVAKPIVPEVEADQEPAQATAAKKKPRVDWNELKARTLGHNLALRSIEVQLESRTEWSGKELADLLVQLEELASRREDLMLYHDLVDSEHLTRPSSLEKPLLKIASLANLLAESEGDAESSNKKLLTGIERRSRELAKEATE